jgi:hypothetical protein
LVIWIDFRYAQESFHQAASALPGLNKNEMGPKIKTIITKEAKSLLGQVSIIQKKTALRVL